MLVTHAKSHQSLLLVRADVTYIVKAILTNNKYD